MFSASQIASTVFLISSITFRPLFFKALFIARASLNRKNIAMFENFCDAIEKENENKNCESFLDFGLQSGAI